MNGFASLRRDALTVFRKEWTDALRDRRTLLVVVLSSVLLGPLVLVALSSLIASLEARAEQREILVAGIDQAPTLRNFLERMTYTVKPAPRDYETQLRALRLEEPVVVVPADFESALRHGQAPVVDVVSDAANDRAQAAVGRIQQLLAGFGREQATLRLAMRGVAPALIAPVEVHERDLANAQARATRYTGMLPFFVLMAVLYGAVNAALDTTAGERERGSLEPLLMTPAPLPALILGKWGAVAGVSMLIATLSCLSFIPSQWLLRSETLQALFRFGPREVLLFLAVLLPFAAALSAVLMAVAIRSRTFKEAQANSTVVALVVSMLPLINLFGSSTQAAWRLWVPALAQNALLTRVLRGESITADQWLVPTTVCAVLTVTGIAWMGARLRAAAVR